MNNYDQWRSSRHASVLEPQGDLALVGMHDIRESNQRIEGLPGIWAPVQVKMYGLSLTATAEDGLSINGNLVEGTVELEADQTIVDWRDGLTFTATYQPGSDHLLAVWNAASDGIADFKEIDAYNYNEEWVLEGSFVKRADEATFDFVHTADRNQVARVHQSPGEVCFEYNGQAFRLQPFVSGDTLIIVFRDQTSRSETYAMGRMLSVTLKTDGKVKLDFNYAFLPPCAFSPYFNCPMPPASNQLPFAITAGEKHVIYK